MNCC